MIYLLALCHFLCPLLFFTDLTRNPYFTQIALLNIFLLCALAFYGLRSWKDGLWKWPKTPLDGPWMMWLGICLLSWAWAYAGHVPFFRPPVAGEGLRAQAFLLTNCLLVFFLPPLCLSYENKSSSFPSLMFFFLAWGFFWSLFPSMRSVLGGDPYGGFLWAAGISFALYRLRRGTLEDFWNLSFAVGALAGIYGLLQYFGVELIWPKMLNPYGSRAVSTFGNPNFLSSYLVVLIPLAAVFYLKSKENLERAFYAFCFWVMAASILSSLTRSSWLGALIGLSALVILSDVRRKVGQDPLQAAVLLVPVLLLAVFWPEGASGGGQAVVSRVRETLEVFKPSGPEVQVYSPWHQRLLIWACSWQMGLENVWTGKGWGLFELFYPFYQGPLLVSEKVFSGLRTHANNAHNEILEVWSQTGILGLGIYGWFWAAFFSSVRNWLKEENRPQVRLWMWGAACGILGMLADNMLNVSLHFAVPAFIFWWQAGAVMGYASRERGEWRQWRPSAPANRLLVLGLLIGCASGGVWWARQWMREVHYFAGFKLTRSPRTEEAVRILKKAHRWHPREVNTNYELGNALARIQRYPEALWAYEEALRANAGYDEIFYNKASILWARLGRPDEAEKNFRMAAWINPFSHDAWAGLISVYVQNPSQYPEAHQWTERAAGIFPQETNFLNSLGYFHSLARRYGEAAQAYARALEADPDFSIAETNLKNTLLKTGASEPAVLKNLRDYRLLQEKIRGQDYSRRTLELAEKAVRDFPLSIKARFYLGNLLLLHRQWARARESLEWVLERDPGHSAARANLGLYWLQQGEKEKAVREFKAALSRDPENGIARQALKDLGINPL